MSVTESPLFPTFDSDTPSATQKERKERVPFRDIWAAMSREEQKAWHEAKIRQSHFRFFDEIAYIASCLDNYGKDPADRKYNVITGMPPAVGIRGVPSGVAVGRNAVRSSSTAFKTFTKANFRHNLGQLTGKMPANAQAHHVFPQKHLSFFNRAGINIHDPRFGVWWKTSRHLKNAAGYNAKWAEFIQLNPNATQSQILHQGRVIMHQYGLPVGF